MRLLRLKADGFGSLRGEFHFAPDRLTLLVDDNERGKSTLLAALAAALYGLEGDRRSHRVLTPLERWRPWDGGSYRIELELENEGEHLTVTRDFDRGTVEVWNDRGQELTAEFRDGKDSFSVGKKLFGIESEDFERCAFVRQGELEQVVPDEERARRASTLHARLENAADTRGGDSNATEALGMLSHATANYACPELDTTVKVETALQRLETKRGILEFEITGLEHDLQQTSGPLEQLAHLSEEETRTRQEIHRWERERRAGRSAEIGMRLLLDDERRAELELLQNEADALAALPQVPPKAEAALRAAVGRYVEAESNLESLAARQRQAEEERARLESEVKGLDLYASYAAEDADRLAVRAEEMRRLERDHDRLRAEFNASREGVSARGYHLERVDLLITRFGALSGEEQELLRTQPQRALALQTQLAAEERTYAQFAEGLRALEVQKTRRRVPGQLLLGLGVIVALAAAVAGAVAPHLPWIYFLAGAGIPALAGLVMLVVASRAYRHEHADLKGKCSQAEERVNLAREQRDESDRRLEAFAAGMNYTSPDGLLREWSDYGRLIEERGPAQHTQQQIKALELRRLQLLEDTQALLEGAGGGPADPAYLEITAAGIRQLIAARQRLSDFERGRAWLDDERAAAEAKVAEIRQEAARILESANLVYNADRPLPDHLDDLAALTQSAARLSLLLDVLLPRAASVVLDDGVHDDLQNQLALLTDTVGALDAAVAGLPSGAPAQAAPSEPAPTPAPAEIESEIERLRGQLEVVSASRNELRLQFEHHWRRSHEALITKRSQLEAVERAHARALRFKRAVDLARETIQEVALDTHRRWAEFLNQRATAILHSMNNDIEQLRFGEDLDFSLKLRGGSQIARGKAALQFSAGARDQLHLAVRLAISEFLSNGRTPLPLLVDDCFATSDDERVRAGMKTLIDLSSRHQVVVVTCHRKRYEALATLDEELYTARVHWLDATARVAR